MFFRKKNDKSKPAEADTIGASLHVIPEVFYGGQDPLIYHPRTVSEERMVKGAATPKRPPPTGKTVSPSPWNKKIFLIVGGAVLLLLAVSGISWYYISQARMAVRERIVQRPVQPLTQPSTPVLEPTPPPTPPTSTEPLVEESLEPSALQEAPLEFPRPLLADSADLDADQLTDVEEELFGTDSGLWDTDGDGYFDGQEVFNLYNPKGFAPIKIVDSGLVREYVNPVWQYRLFYPIYWDISAVDPESKQVLLTAITGDFIEVRAVAKENVGESFDVWFASHAEGEQFTDLSILTNRFQVEGKKRSDDLVAYFETNETVYVLLYHPGTIDAIPFRHVMRLIYQSFRPGKTSVDIPEQSPLPPPLITETFDTSSEGIPNS